MNLEKLAAEHDDLKNRSEDADPTLDDEDRARMAQLDKLARDLGDDLWDANRKGYHFIEEIDFEDYARELAEDCYGRISYDKWPLSFIDWEKAANELRQDYNVIDFENKEYLYLDP